MQIVVKKIELADGKGIKLKFRLTTLISYVSKK